MKNTLPHPQKAAKLLVNCLEQHSVEFIFCIPGAKIDAVFDALLDSSIRMIVCRHEQNAGFMAAAYGRLTGKPGVVLVTSGPGVGNLTTALLTATTEGDPVVAIGGNVARNMKLKESHQSTDNLKLMQGTSKAQMEVLSADTIPEVIMNAFRIASRPRSGAVFISLPQDVASEMTHVTADAPIHDGHFGPAASTVLSKTTELLCQAKRPILLLGMEASRPDNTAAIRSFLKTHPLPVVSTYQAAGVISKDLLPLFVGRVGLFKNQPGDQLLDAADLILSIGFDPVEYDPEIWNITQNTPIIHLDYQPCDIRLPYQPILEVLGDIAENINALAKEIFQQGNPSFASAACGQERQEGLDYPLMQQEPKPDTLHPLQIIKALQTLLTDTTTLTCDIGSHYIWLARHLLSFNPHQLLFSNGQQTLGVALPWAMAATLARPNHKVISVSGDGGFLFSSMELETAVREKMNFVHIVWVDGFYDMVKEQQLIKYKRDSAVTLGRVDIVKFAEAFGATGYRVTKEADLLPTLQKALAQQGPVLIEIPVDYRDNPALFSSTHVDVGG